MGIKYCDVYRKGGNMQYVETVRYDIVVSAKEIGIKPTARKYSCSKNTVKSWLERFNLLGMKGLKDESKKPINSPKQINKTDIDLITNVVLEAKEKQKYITVNNVRKKTGITDYSDETINRYINKACGKTRNPKKTKTNGKSTAFKEKLKPFDIMQIDIKYLTDIDSLKPYFNEFDCSKSLVPYEITFRDVATGLALVCYCYEKSVVYTNIFLRNIIVPFLKQFNIDLKKCKIQTDNGTEFTTKYIASKNGTIPKDTAFTITANEYFKRHKTNIPGHSTANSEVESFHWSIERDCLAWDDIVDNNSLIENVTKYIEEYNRSEIKTRGYSPLDKLKKYFDLSNISFPKPQILELDSNDIITQIEKEYAEVA